MNEPFGMASGSSKRQRTWADCQVVLGELAEVFGEMFERVVGGIDGPDDFAEAAGIAFGAVEDLVERSPGGVVGRQRFAGEFADHGDFGEVGPEIVVQVAGDAGAFLGESGAGVGFGELACGAPMVPSARDLYGGNHGGDDRHSLQSSGFPKDAGG